MKRQIPFLIAALLFCLSVAVLVRVPAVRKLGVLPGKVAAELESHFPPAASGAQPVFIPEEPQPVTETVNTVPAEAAQLPELRIAAITNGIRYGWIQLPRGTRVELLSRNGDWLFIKFQGAQVRVHRTVVDAGLISPVARPRRPLAAL
jgi:hypothetical protein